MGMNSACLQRCCSALLETAALHARAWKQARSRSIQSPRQTMELRIGAEQILKDVSRACAQYCPKPRTAFII